MCGICGKINFESKNNVDPGLIECMTKVMVHRGPDEEGYHIKDNLGLGVRRLSIIDRASGHQPISNEDKTIWIIFNGEIYNYLELMSILKDKGHRFYSRCDTEVIIHAYEEYGEDCVNHLRGMFAFAIWDERERRLFICRDRLGIKPLYYVLSNGSLVFASEIKAILQDPDIKAELNLEALHHFLTFAFMPGPQTMFNRIQKLLPGYTLTYQDGKIDIKQYWDLCVDIQQIKDEKHYLRPLEDILTETIRIHLRSDVPLGVFLSGGIDSSTIVGLMARFLNQPIRTFSIGFGIKNFDELRYARKISRIFGTDHHEFIIKPDAMEILPKVIWHLEEPLADAAILGLYYLSQMAKEFTTVVLAGEGGDETFAGYPRYYWHRKAQIYNQIPLFLRRGILNPLIDNFAFLPHNLSRRAKKFIRGASKPETWRYTDWFLVFSDELKRQIYNLETKSMHGLNDPAMALSRYFNNTTFTDPISKAQYVDIKTYLVDNLLLKADKITSAFSLEARLPFLDHKLVEFVSSIPVNLKLRGYKTKYILKRLISGFLPSEITKRRKQGFMIPIQNWFRKDLYSYAYDILLDRRAKSRGLFNITQIEVLLKKLKKGQYLYAEQVYCLINFEMWNRVFIDGKEN